MNRPSDGAEWESPAEPANDRRLAGDRELPSRTDPVVARLSTSIGGPVGLHAAVGRNRTWTPLRILFLISLVVLAFGWFGKAGCIQQTPVGGDSSQMRLDWDDQRQFFGLCYSNIVAGYGENRLTPEDLAAGTAPYRTYWTVDGERRYIGVPVLTGAFMYMTAQLARGATAAGEAVGLPMPLPVVSYFNIAALLLALGWLIAVWATMRTRSRKPWIVAVMALSPIVLVHAFTAFDVLPVMFVALALYAWSRDRFKTAGLFIGLGAATAFYPLLLIPAMLVLAVRRREFRDVGRVVGTAVLAWAAVNVPVAATYPSGWAATFTEWRDRAADRDTVYMLISYLSGWNPSVTLVNALTVALGVAVVAGVVYVGLRAPREPSLAALMFLLVAGLLLVGKEWRPESSLWLVPLAVLAIPHPRILFAWMTVEALLWIPRMSLFLEPDRKWLTVEWFYLAAVVRGLFVAGLCAYLVWNLLRPVARGPVPVGHLMESPAPSVPSR